jgi:DNA polymerase III gamma/tau subunit
VNEQSQQVFRNYIDKYKNNVHFISVCTNIQKVIESIQSRIHIIQLQPPSNEEIKSILNYIIKQESIIIDEESIEHLLVMSNNSLRVLINYLEKIYIYGEPITIDICKKMCSTISIQKFEEYIELLESNKLHQAIMILYDIYDQGYSVIDILDYFYMFVKITEVINEETKYKMIPFLCKYITIFNKLHEDVIELAFFTNNLHNLVREI